MLPDAVEDNGGKGDAGQNDQHRPDRAEETGRQTDEESGDIEYSYDFDDYSSIDFGFKNNKLCDVIVYVSTW